MSEYGIFEHLIDDDNRMMPINEGLGLALLLAPFIFPFILVVASAGFLKINDMATNSKIKKSLHKAERDPEIGYIAKKIKTIRSLKNDEIKDICKSEKDYNNLKMNQGYILGMFDSNGNILAYCVSKSKYINEGYAYYITDNTIQRSEKINKYIQALFEYNLGYIGPGIVYFDKSMKKGDINFFNNNNKIDASSIPLTKEEFNNIKKDIDKYSKIAKSILEKHLSKYYTIKSENYKHENPGAIRIIYDLKQEYYDKELELADLKGDYDYSDIVTKEMQDAIKSAKKEIDYRIKHNNKGIIDDSPYIKINYSVDNDSFAEYIIISPVGNYTIQESLYFNFI